MSKDKPTAQELEDEWFNELEKSRHTKDFIAGARAALNYLEMVYNPYKIPLTPEKEAGMSERRIGYYAGILSVIGRLAYWVGQKKVES